MATNISSVVSIIVLVWMILIHYIRSCDVTKSVTTTYNENELIPTYVGIMFAIDAQVDLTILTFAMDLRVDNTTINPNLSVEVYAKDGDFSGYVSLPAAWTKVATSTFIPMNSNSNPNGGIVTVDNTGAIIPYTQFTPVTITKGNRKSFYVTLQEPYIDFNVNALQKPGEAFYSNSDMTIYVGSGFSEPNFPSMGINTTVDPQFSGVVYYEMPSPSVDSSNCTNAIDRTDMQYDFLFNYDMVPTDVTNIVQQTIQSTMQQLMQTDPLLQSYVADYQLQIVSNDTKTDLLQYYGSCPKGWDACPKVYPSIHLTLSNQLPLQPGLVKYQIYRVCTDTIVQNVGVTLKKSYPNIQYVYIGTKAIVANYTARVDNVPGPMTSDSIQEYFGSVATNIANTDMQSKYGNVFYTSITEQTPMPDATSRRASKSSLLRNGNRRDLQQQSTIMKVKGQMYGGQAAALTAEDYQTNLGDALAVSSSNIFNQLKMAAYIPSSVNNTDALSYFSTMTNFKAAITSVDQPSSSGSGSSSNNNNNNNNNNNPNSAPSGNNNGSNTSMIIIIIASIIGACILILVTLFCCKAARSYHDKLDSRKKRRNRENDDSTTTGSNKKPRKATDKTSSSKSTAAEEEEGSVIVDFELEKNGKKLFMSPPPSSYNNKNNVTDSRKKNNLDAFLEKQKSSTKDRDKLSGSRSVDGGDVGDSRRKKPVAKKPVKEAEDAPLQYPAGTQEPKGKRNIKDNPTSNGRKKEPEQPNNNVRNNYLDRINSYHIKAPKREHSTKKKMLHKESEDLSHEFRRSLSVPTKPKKKVPPSLIDYMNQQPKSSPPKGTAKSVG